MVRITGVMLLAGVALAIFGWDVLEPLLHRERYRGQVVALYYDLQLGMTKLQVQAVMDSAEYPDLRIDRADAERWFGAAPSEFGGGNWVLSVDFRSDRVTAVRVRTEDSVEDHPAEAPRDKT